MDFQRMKWHIRRMVGISRYYGLAFYPEYILAKFKLTKSIRVVEQVEKKYCDITEIDLVDTLRQWFLARTGERLELENPITFNQKIQWLKLYDQRPEKVLLVDKYLVRDWVANKIGQKYLVPLLGVWECFDEINFNQLPQKFALKCNHGSGWNIIVEDKSKFDKQEAKRKIDLWMKKDFAYEAGFELQYSYVKPKIIAEEYMENEDGDIYDYKFYCFNGQAKFIQFLMGRKKHLQMAYFDTEWNKQKFVHNHPRIEKQIPKPDNLTEMIELAETLSQGFSYVRVDFYRLNDGRIRFGEMTFSPASGTQDWKPSWANYMLGDLIVLPEKRNEIGYKERDCNG